MQRLFLIVMFYILFSFNNEYIYSQNIDTLFGFKNYDVTNEYMEHTLKEVVSLVDDCPYFKKLNKQCFIALSFDTNTLIINVYPQNTTTVYFYRNFAKKNGFCFNTVLNKFPKKNYSPINRAIAGEKSED